MSNLEKGFTISREECEQRAQRGDAVRETDLPVEPCLHAALTTIHSEIKAVEIENSRGSAQTLRRDVGRKAYPNDIDFEEPQNSAERKESVALNLARIIIHQLKTSLTNIIPYGSAIAYLESMNETFLSIEQKMLKIGKIRVEPFNSTEETGWIEALLESDISQRITRYLNNLEIHGGIPFANDTFKIHRISDSSDSPLSIRIDRIPQSPTQPRTEVTLERID